MTTAESGRRFGPDDLTLAEELARRAAHIVENARLQRELRRSEERFRIALAAGSVTVYEQDADLRYRFAYNTPIPGDWIGKRHDDFVSAEDALRLDELKQRAIRGEQVRAEIELGVHGERRHFRQALEPVRDGSGAVVGLIGAATDITREKRVQAELAQAVSFRERMIGILGHDLRNPLNAIAMAAGMLRHAELPERARDYALRIDHAGKRMGEMIGTLLDFAQARFRGALPVSPVPADLAQIARDVVEEGRTAWPDRQIELVARGNPRGSWDPARIAQAISNLVANAVAHGAPDAPVRVEIESSHTEVCLAVANTGPAIPEEMMPVLFEPFRRGSDDSRGVGLGLYIVRQIVLAHAGSIEVASSPGSETRFTLRLPRLSANDARAERSPIGAG